MFLTLLASIKEDLIVEMLIILLFYENGVTDDDLYLTKFKEIICQERPKQLFSHKEGNFDPRRQHRLISILVPNL